MNEPGLEEEGAPDNGAFDLAKGRVRNRKWTMCPNYSDTNPFQSCLLHSEYF